MAPGRFRHGYDVADQVLREGKGGRVLGRGKGATADTGEARSTLGHADRRRTNLDRPYGTFKNGPAVLLGSVRQRYAHGSTGTRHRAESDRQFAEV